MAEIQLSRGLIATIDDADLPLVSEYTWHAVGYGMHVYAVAGARQEDGKGRIKLHRLLMGNPPAAGMHVDHINGNTLDNRRCNLRWAECWQNLANRAARTGKSKYRGVWPASNGKWRAAVMVRGNRVYLGSFATEEQAAAAVDAQATKMAGEFARLNLTN